MFNFTIKNEGPFSSQFLLTGKSNFLQAANFIQHLPYGRNANKYDLITLFSDQCGTCSTKHAVLKTLAMENKVPELRLMIGIYKMNASNTPPVSSALAHFNLEYIPEAHCYLRYKDSVLDYTKISKKPFNFLPDLLEEIEIYPDQISDYKVNYHRKFLSKWLLENPRLSYTPDEIWAIREKCILALSD